MKIYFMDYDEALAASNNVFPAAPQKRSIWPTHCVFCYYKLADHSRGLECVEFDLVEPDDYICPWCRSCAVWITDKNRTTLTCSYCLYQALTPTTSPPPVFTQIPWNPNRTAINPPRNQEVSDQEPNCSCDSFLLRWGTHQTSCKFPAWNQARLEKRLGSGYIHTSNNDRPASIKEEDKLFTGRLAAGDKVKILSFAPADKFGDKSLVGKILMVDEAYADFANPWPADDVGTWENPGDPKSALTSYGFYTFLDGQQSRTFLVCVRVAKVSK